MQTEQVTKVRQDLGITQQNMAVFSEMLAELTPGQEHPEDRSLFAELHATCRAMQTRLVELIDQVQDDSLTAELLEVNDDMNNLFLRYDRYQKNVSASLAKQQGARQKVNAAPLVSKLPSEAAPLIDFGNSSEVNPAPASLAPSLGQFKDDDADKLADWIGEENMEKAETTQEFDQFLAERAAAGETPKRQ